MKVAHPFDNFKAWAHLEVAEVSSILLSVTPFLAVCWALTAPLGLSGSTCKTPTAPPVPAA